MRGQWFFFHRNLTRLLAMCSALSYTQAARIELDPADERLRQSQRVNLGSGSAASAATHKEFDFVESANEGRSASNKLHGFVATVTPEGLEVQSTASSATTAFSFHLRLLQFGRAKSLSPVRSGVVRTEGARVELDREVISEYFVNQRHGLKHGLTLYSRPTVVGSEDGTLLLDFEFEGAAMAFPEDAEGQGISIRAPSGRPAARYADLAVFDASGRKLPSKMSLSSRRITIEIDDKGARYPVIVDPILTGPANTVESNQADAQFGYSVAVAGDVNGDGFSDVIVGAPNFDDTRVDEGRVFVYYGSAGGISATPSWTVSGGQAGAHLGISVSTAGDVNGDGFHDVIVGAYRWDGSFTDEGRALVYYGSATGLGTSPWVTTGGQAGARAGISVSDAGDVNGDGFDDVIVGAYRWDGGEVDEGRALVYLGSGIGLSPVPAWTQEGNQAYANYGYSVSGAGDVNADRYADVIVGAYAFDAGESAEGRASVYLGSGGGVSSTAMWTAEGNQVAAWFGYSVARAGDVNGDGYADVIVGAPQFDSGETDEGRAFVFLGSQTGLAADPAWLNESNQAFAKFGISVSTAGDVNGDGLADVVVGAEQMDGGAIDDGRVFLFHGTPSSAESVAQWTADGVQAGAALGRSVAAAGDIDNDGFGDIVLGASLHDNGETDEGMARVFRGTGFVLQTNPVGSIGGVWVGDVNGDGLGDIVRTDFTTRSNTLHLGSASGPVPEAAWSAYGTAFGASVGGVGDVNGDGFADVVLGASNYSNGESGEGRIALYVGSPAGLRPNASWTWESNRVGGGAGESFALDGDFNGDGFADIAVRVYDWVNEPCCEDRSRILVFYGAASGPSSTPDWVSPALLGSTPTDQLTSVGDTNRDGFSDLFAYQRGDGTTVYLGSPIGLQLFTTLSNNTCSRWVTAGDVNGDGYSDMLLASDFYCGTSGSSHTELYYGAVTGPNASGWSRTADPVVCLRQQVSGEGDLNGDGYSDFAIRMCEVIEIYLGSPTGPAPLPALTLPISEATDLINGGGDIDGDGFSDLMQSNAMYRGNGPGNRTRSPQQRRPDDSAGVIAEGRVDAASGFLVAQSISSASGRARLTLQAEVRPLGAPFIGVPTAVSGRIDTGLPATNGSAVRATQQIGNTLAGIPLRWRARAENLDPKFPHSAWFGVPENAVSLTDIRPRDCLTPIAFHRDADADLFGDPLSGRNECTAPGGWVIDSTDCDDTRPAAYPGAVEICDGQDEDCDSTIDEGFDVDLDGYKVCSGDCDDTRANVHPGLEDICDGLDNDCDARVDNPPPLGKVADLRLAEAIDGTRLSWRSITSASGYDAVRGAISRLRSTGGNFESATDTCLANNYGYTSLIDPDGSGSGDGFWYLIRAVDCGGFGSSYNDDSQSQQGDRDAEIGASPSACP